MVGNWRERKESGVDTKEGSIKVSVLKAVLFLWRGLKPHVHVMFKLIDFIHTSIVWKLMSWNIRYVTIINNKNNKHIMQTPMNFW